MKPSCQSSKFSVFCFLSNVVLQFCSLIFRYLPNNEHFKEYLSPIICLRSSTYKFPLVTRLPTFNSSASNNSLSCCILSTVYPLTIFRSKYRADPSINSLSNKPDSNSRENDCLWCDINTKPRIHFRNFEFWICIFDLV